MDHETQSRIITGLHKGDREAWLDLYDASAERMYGRIVQMTGGDDSCAQDIMQETFLSAAKSAGSFHSARGTLWMWLWGIAKNQIALYYRKQASQKRLYQARQWWASCNGQKMEWIDAFLDTPLEVLERRELSDLVRYALNELPADYQFLLLEKYADSRPVNDIAQETGQTPAAVMSKLTRARKAFRKAFIKISHSTPETREVSR